MTVKNKESPCAKNHCLTCALGPVLNDMRITSATTPASGMPIAIFWKDYLQGIQQDSAEFLDRVLERLDNEGKHHGFESSNH